MWRPGKGTGRGKPKNYPSETPQPAEESRGGNLPEADSAPESGPSEMRPEDWSRDYAGSAQWGEVWRQIQVPGGEWPAGYRLQHGWMIRDGRICVPEARTKEVAREQHRAMGHTGVKKLASELTRRYLWPAGLSIMEVAQRVRRECITCQACDPPNWNTRAPLVPTPIPRHIMTSVALDIFSLPRVEWRGKTFDSMLVCVDRLSGWVIARTTIKLGLTAERAAHLVMDDGWDIFGVPAVITSDQGPQFVGQWWRTICARLGIRQAWSQAYRPQANGRAEVAGKTLMGFMRRLWVELGINWVEALPRVLRAYHDTRGESGYSPFQIVFGRERFVAGAPLPVERECEGRLSLWIGWNGWTKKCPKD